MLTGYFVANVDTINMNTKAIPTRIGMRKILFLDCDGVINNRQSFLEEKSNTFPTDPKCVELVNLILDETGCEIVLSSTWRFYNSWKSILTPLFGEILYTTTKTGSHKSRGEEIDDWLFKNFPPGRWLPPCESAGKFCILDDDKGMLDYQLPYFIRTSFETGITEPQALQAIQILNRFDS